MWAKQSTAATLIVGPILDSTGAEYTSAVIGDLSLSKNGGTLTALASAATLTHIANGQYTLVTTTGNLDTLGRAQITCNKSTYQMPPVNLMVVPAMVFDSMVLGTDVLQTDVTQLLGTAWLTPGTAGTPDVNAKQIGSTAQTGSDVGAKVTAMTKGLIAGVVGSSSSTTVVNVTSTESGLAVTDQLKGRVIIFNKDTTTAALRGQGAPIDTNDTTSITVASGDAFTTAPASGDTFTIY